MILKLMERPQYVYVARIDSSGNPTLTVVELVQETVNAFDVNVDSQIRPQSLPGWTLPSHIMKDDLKYYVTRSQYEALDWLLSKVDKSIEHKTADLERTSNYRGELSRILATNEVLYQDEPAGENTND